MENFISRRVDSKCVRAGGEKGAKIRENRGLRAETTPLFPKNYSEARRRKTPFDEFSTPKRGSLKIKH